MTDAKFTGLPAVLLVLALLGGCQAGGGVRKEGGNAATETTIEARAVQRWKYLIAREGDKAYDYLSPGYRKTISRSEYAATMGARPVKWAGVGFNKKECEEDLCNVFLLVDYEVSFPGSGPKPIKTFAPLHEKWVRSSGQWYFLPEK